MPHCCVGHLNLLSRAVMQGIPYYNKDTFTVNATLLSSASQLKYAGGRAAAALLQASTHCASCS